MRGREKFLSYVLLSIVLCTAGCIKTKDEIKKDNQATKENIEIGILKGVDNKEDNNKENNNIKLTIGETTEKELWTQTYVYPSNIEDTFVIDICLPKNYEKEKEYPVVYLTDCYWRREDYKKLQMLYETEVTKEYIIIGIGYPDDYDFETIRERDLIREPDKFLSMIVDGIIPFVESNYKIDSKDRTFCGASYGGFFMLYSLLQSDGLTKDVFKNYILASPTFMASIGEISLIECEESFSKRTKDLKVNVYLTVGGEEGEHEFLEPIRNFVETVEQRNYNGLNLRYKEYEGKDHYEVWVPALVDGLKLYLAK